MGIIFATCGHQLSEEEGVGEPFWLYDGGEFSWLAYCNRCKAHLTPVYTYDVNNLLALSTENSNEYAQEDYMQYECLHNRDLLFVGGNQAICPSCGKSWRLKKK